ncbi:hypothetical protein HDE_12324 [Halotydeus destructor]|nr:hypothetical protein HDE_12324 [Halotydeus destructor]
MFGRDKTRRQDSSNSSKRNSPVDTSRQAKIKPETSIPALPATEVLTTKPESSSPPRKLYYRRDLLSDKSDASGDEQTSFSKEYQRDEATATNEKVNVSNRVTNERSLG